MKIAFNRMPRRTPWGGGAHFATTFADYLTTIGHQVVYTLEPGIHAIVMLDPRHEDGGFSAGDIARYKQSNPNVKVLHRVNDTGKTRGGDELDRIIMGSNAVADATVFISSWVADYYASKDMRPSHSNVCVITNGCDERYFHAGRWTSTEWQRIRSGSDGKTFFPPGFNKPHAPIRLVTHHWSNNPSKGVDLYEHIDELIDVGGAFEFTYIGRYPAGHIPKHTKIIAPLYGIELGDELRKHDVYVTGARWEACGSHHVEGAACGLPVIFHGDGGGVVEMCQRYGEELVGGVKGFQDALETIKDDYVTYSRRAFTADLSADTMCKKYLDVIVRMTT